MTTHPATVKLDRCIASVWRRSQWVGLLQGGLVFVGWAVMLFLAALAVDRLFSLPASVRVVIVLALLGVSIYKGWLAGWRHLRRFDPVRSALRIEAHCGGLDSLLISAVQFRDSANDSGIGGGLTMLTCQRAEEAAASLKAEEVVRFGPLRQPAIGALIALAALSGLAIADTPTLQVGAARIFAPWLAIEYPTRTQLTMKTGDLIVQEGKPVRIAAAVAGVIPDNARIALRTGSGRPRLNDLPVVDGTCTYQIDTVFREFDYQITAGDSRSDWHTVRVVYPPNIQKARVTLNYPAYTQRAPETVEAMTLTIPETTQVQWVLSLDQSVREASVNLAGQEPLPMSVSDDGRTVSFEMTAADSRSYNFSWVEQENGFVFDSPSYYLQVAPDRAPRVELTSPSRNLYAMLGREIKLACRTRDDHGIAEASVIYSVDKIEEQTVAFTPAQTTEGGEQVIDWDYRTALPELVEGQAVTFAVEAVDRYPGAEGPHRSRSELRRIQFVSEEEYLAQIERQKRRLLSRLRTIYREQRQVFEVVLQLDPASPVFVQNCQLEAVRQDLMRERLHKLADGMAELTDDLQANGITDTPLTHGLDRLNRDINMIATDHVAAAAEALRSLAGRTQTSDQTERLGMTDAVKWVDSAARELGLRVLQLGYEDASEVMVREMHAAAQNQAVLRLHTITTSSSSPELAIAQQQLGRWLKELFEASPKGSETSVEEALVEFTLTRMIKQLIRSGVEARSETAADLLQQGAEHAEAARLQEQIIAALLEAEFRLRVGAEREALSEALVLFTSQVEQQAALRSTISALDASAFDSRRAELAQQQAELQANLQLLLLPEIPAHRPRLFDDVFPLPPAVAELLASADQAMAAAATSIEAGDRSAAVQAQRNAEAAFAALADIVGNRIAQLTEAVRIERLAYGSQEVDGKLELFSERQLALLERTEDAAADESPAAYLADQQRALADAVDELAAQVVRADRSTGSSAEANVLPGRIREAAKAMRQSAALLANNQPDDAAAHQETADAALAACRELLAEHNAHLSAYAAMLGLTRISTAPSPYVGEIEQEQSDLLAITRNTAPDDMPALAVPQKNLVHAVDAILVALDPISHMVETGTVMLFAKEDMNAAGIALAESDPVEALDAQTFIVETLQELRTRIDAVVPRYPYLLEMVEALHESVAQGVMLREDQRQLREQLLASPSDAADLAPQQQALLQRMQAYAKLIEEIAGPTYEQTASIPMGAALQHLSDADAAKAASQMLVAERTMRNQTERLLTLMQRLTLALAAPEPGKAVPDEILLMREVMSLAARQKATFRTFSGAEKPAFDDVAADLRAMGEALAPLIKRASQHTVPEDGAVPAEPRALEAKLADAQRQLNQAAAGAGESDRNQAISGQRDAAESLRHFVADYALLFVAPPAGPSDNPPAPTTDFNETEDTLQLFMPGAVTGTRPPDGRLEWEVLGKRDRAALNENFARELPLEFRAILKNYYERLAQ